MVRGLVSRLSSGLVSLSWPYVGPGDEGFRAVEVHVAPEGSFGYVLAS